MEFHRGRLFDHIHLRTSDLEKSRNFYQAIFTAMGLSDVLVEGDGFFYADELWVDKAKDYVTRIHLAFPAESPDMVRAMYEAALDAGGTDNGAPGERPYHPGYYSAYMLDPDGNNIEAVYHGPFKRSADSVILTAG